MRASFRAAFFRSVVPRFRSGKLCVIVCAVFCLLFAASSCGSLPLRVIAVVSAYGVPVYTAFALRRASFDLSAPVSLDLSCYLV